MKIVCCGAFRRLKRHDEQLRHQVPPPPEGDRGWVQGHAFTQSGCFEKILCLLTHPQPGAALWNTIFHGASRKSQIPNPKSQISHKRQMPMTQTRNAQIRKYFKVLPKTDRT